MAEARTERTLKELSAIAALLATLFSAAGFLGVRAWLNRLGIPSHAELSPEGYLQHGGRLLFAVAVHLLPVCLALYLLLALGRGIRRQLAGRPARFPRPTTAAFLVVLLALAALLVELPQSSSGPVFEPGRSPGFAPGEAGLLRLFAAELLVAAAALGLALSWRSWRWRSKTSPMLRYTSWLAAVTVGVALLLLPVSFGRVAMVAGSMPSVEMLDDAGEEVAAGLLVFTGANSHFVWIEDENLLLQLERSRVATVRYLGSRSLEPNP